MMKTKVITGLLFFLNAFYAQAQFNDSVKHYIKFTSTGVLNKTETANSYVLRNSLNFNAEKKHLSYNTFIGWVYGAQSSSITNNDFTVNATLDINKRQHKIYYWALINFDKSYSLNINHRLHKITSLLHDVTTKNYYHNSY